MQQQLIITQVKIQHFVMISNNHNGKAKFKSYFKTFFYNLRKFLSPRRREPLQIDLLGTYGNRFTRKTIEIMKYEPQWSPTWLMRPKGLWDAQAHTTIGK